MKLNNVTNLKYLSPQHDKASELVSMLGILGIGVSIIGDKFSY